MKRKIVALFLTISMLVPTLLATTVFADATDVGLVKVEGWFESLHAEWSAISGADGYKVYIAKNGSSDWALLDSELVRKTSGGYEADAVGLKAGDYRMKVVPTLGGKEQGGELMSEVITVMPYDRSGYAHFNYTEGVGAYNDDGTLKKNAIVLYVTEENKNTVSLTSKDGTTVVGIGNILNSVGKNDNKNSDIIRKLAKDGTPLVVRIIGKVTAPKGLTAYNSTAFGGTKGDNGFMARMQGGKDITIEGVGSDATMDGWGIHFMCDASDYKAGIGRSFEVRNIAFRNVPEDCIGMEGVQSSGSLTGPVERCWVHHCSFYAPTIANPAESDKDGGDGACDFKRGQYFTNSYCYYEGYHKTNLVGASDDNHQYHITYHHNYWKNCDSRGPLARKANIHMYNNIFDGQTSYCMNPRADAYIFSEYNMFIESKNPVTIKSGAVKSYNDSYLSCIGDNQATVVENKTDKVASANKYANFDTNSALSYIPDGDYILHDSISEMRSYVLAYAGTQKNDIITPLEAVISVIPSSAYPTAAVSSDYSVNFTKSYISASGVKDNIVFNITKASDGYIGIGGTAGCNIVFYVDRASDITIIESSASENRTVLATEWGEVVMIGGGSVSNLPSGYYFIQSDNYDVGSGKFKEARIASLSIKAHDPNATPNPIPTPPPAGGDDTPVDPDQGGNNEGGNTGNEGGNQGGNNTPIPSGSQTHSFTDNGKVDPESFFIISGNTSNSKGSVNYNGMNLTTCLKIESSTKISFSSDAGRLILVFGGTTSAVGKQIKVDSKSYDIPTSQVVEIELLAGAHEVAKDDSINLFFMAFVPAETETHTHSYSERITEPTCTLAGRVEYTCSCGDNYSETLKATGHHFTDGFCADCGIDDPNYIPEDNPTDDPEGNPTDKPEDNPTDDPTDDPDHTPESPEEEPEKELNFIEAIWKAIVDFFKWLFGIED